MIQIKSPKATNSARKPLNSSRKVKKIEETEIGPSTKSIIKYHCKICGAGFAQTNNYTKHLQTHNEYVKYVGNHIENLQIVVNN